MLFDLFIYNCYCMFLVDWMFLIYLSAYENEELIALTRDWHSVYRPSLQASGFSSAQANFPCANCKLLFEHILLIVLSWAKLNGVFLMRKRVWIPIHMLQLMSNPTSNRCWPLYYKGMRANYSWTNFQFWPPIRNVFYFQGYRSV